MAFDTEELKAFKDALWDMRATHPLAPKGAMRALRGSGPYCELVRTAAGKGPHGCDNPMFLQQVDLYKDGKVRLQHSGVWHALNLLSSTQATLPEIRGLLFSWYNQVRNRYWERGTAPLHIMADMCRSHQRQLEFSGTSLYDYDTYQERVYALFEDHQGNESLFEEDDNTGLVDRGWLYLKNDQLWASNVFGLNVKLFD
jgi:hypothetical protein